MGGNIWKDKTRRYSREEYFSIEEDVLRKLSSLVKEARPTLSYDSKSSFGDLDILVIPNKDFSDSAIREIFSTENTSKNGSVLSFLYKDFQIDLITTNDVEMEYSYRYFNFQDRGNLVGRFAHKLGLKHGHNGLILPVRSSDTHVIGEVILTRDPVRAEKFLGVIPESSFTDLEAIFNNVASSKYFNPEIFLLENRNSTSRTRDRKRATYSAFLKWCEGISTDKEFYQFDRRDSYIELIFSEFPESRIEFDNLWENKRLVDSAYEKFNGSLVSLWTGCEGEMLGKLIRSVKKELTQALIVEYSHDKIIEIVKKHMEEL